MAEFDFIVTARYHAAVHAYKREIPALVFGWAPKYTELLEMFHQQKYLVDFRKPWDAEEVMSRLEHLLQNTERERRVIRGRRRALAALDNREVFSALDRY
jgi:polysaccharide pyruvyl transferase WcaK-like protein